MRFALRTLWRSLAFALTAIGTIALAMSLAATVFAIVDGVLFKPLPYRDADRLFSVAGTDGGGSATLAPADAQYLREADDRITITTFAPGARGLRSADRPDVVLRGAAIERNFFDVLGQHPLIGGFTVDHFAAAVKPYDGEPAIISYALWRNRLGADRGVIGRVVDFLDARLLIVGVLPSDFVFPEAMARGRPDVLVTLVHEPSELKDRWARSVMAIARLDRAVPALEAKAKLDAALATRAAEYPPRPNLRPRPYIGVMFRPLEETLGRTERPLFRTAFAGAVLLIVLGCVNVAGLLTVRGHDRERELSIRAALGASRSQLAGLLLTEAASLALIGALAGVLVARPLLSLTMAMLPENVLLLKPPAIDWRVVAFTIASGVVTMVVMSALSVASILRPALVRGLAGNQTSTVRVRSWTRATTLAVESALGLALVVAGSLMLASYIGLRAEDPGLDRNNLAVLDVIAPGAGRTPLPEETRLRQGRILARLRTVPGVNGAALAATPLLENSSNGSTFQSPPGSESIFANDIPVSGAFFEVTQLRLLDGRLPTQEEIDTGRPLAVVSDRTARAYWPGRRAVGQPLVGGGGKISVTVIGVVAEARFSSQAETSFGEIYFPMSLRPRPSNVYFLRTSGDPSLVAREAAVALNRDVPGIVVRRAESYEMALAKSVRLHRFRATLFSVAALAGLLLLAVGVSGLVSMGVARRVRELGIRATLGARRAQLGRMIVVDHLRPVIAGAALGLIASWWTTTLLSGFLYDFEPHDPRIWTAASAVLLIVAALAAWIPARRASGVDPAVILRIE
jgi:putative ABC transport system permease protein